MTNVFRNKVFATLKYVSVIGISASAFAVSGLSVSAQENLVPSAQTTEEINGVSESTYTFTNEEYFNTVESLGYDVSEYVNNPDYNPDKVNYVRMKNSQKATSSNQMIQPAQSAILDQTTAVISSDVLNNIKDLGVVAAAAVLVFHVPNLSVATSIAQQVISYAEITSDLEITMVLQQTGATPAQAQWVVTNYRWV